MIGVALVSFVSIFAASTTASVNQLFAEQVAADFTLQPAGFGGTGVPGGVVESLRELEETGAVSPVSFAQAEHDGEPAAVSGVSPADIGDLADVEVVAGDLAGLGNCEVVVSEEFADTSGLAVGDATTLVLPGTGDVEVTVQGVYRAGGLMTSPFLASTELLRSNGAGGFTHSCSSAPPRAWTRPSPAAPSSPRSRTCPPSRSWMPPSCSTRCAARSTPS